MKDKLLVFLGGGVFFFFLFLLFGGIYTITPANGPVDAAYKINRLTGKVWLVKSYTKQIGPIRMLAAREAEVEKTKELKESDIPEVAISNANSTRR